MSNEITYNDAKKFFQSHKMYWDAFVAGILAKREDYIADLKRNAETPNCNKGADEKAIGAMLAVDDLYYDFKLPALEDD